jgi:hypothetical protein
MVDRVQLSRNGIRVGSDSTLARKCIWVCMCVYSGITEHSSLRGASGIPTNNLSFYVAHCRGAAPFGPDRPKTSVANQ